MNEQQFSRETHWINIEDEMRESYLDYAMSVIVGRALPDVRDGLKPVHRRALFAMHELGNDWNKAYKKSARIVGDVIGKYHPHGDQSVYDTIVRMAQPFSLRYLLVDGQGNFGSVDGDNAAAMRYTEIRMTRLTHELMADLDKETVDFVPNYDGSEEEPQVLPTRIPNLLINGSSGIAVGMATNIPPHNLNEVIDGLLLLLREPDASIEALLEKIPAPDFPTAGLIYGLNDVHEAYRTGRGRVVMRAKTHIEELKGERQAIIVDEIPYQVNKANLLSKIGDLVRNKVLEGIADLRDESDKSGMRIVIELKRGVFPDVVLNHLYKHTQLQDNFSINMVALLDGQPKLLNLKDILLAFLRHRREVVTRRTIFELRKARERGHVLEGLAVALSNADLMIALIQSAKTPQEARQALMQHVWSSDLLAELFAQVDPQSTRPAALLPEFGWQNGVYRLSDTQAQAILDLRLQRLTGLEKEKIQAEYRDIITQIAYLNQILQNPAQLTQIIVEELEAIRSRFGDARRTEINISGGQIDLHDLIPKQDMVVTLSHLGYIKTQPVADYQAQKRGGRGKQATTTKDEDFVKHLCIAHSHDYLLCFSNFGRVYWAYVLDLPTGSRNALGRPVANVLSLSEGEFLTAMLPVSEFSEDQFVMMATRQGVVKKTPLSQFSNPRETGIIALKLDEGDTLLGVALTAGSHDVMLFSNEGKALRFDENKVRAMGRAARGVVGMRLGEGAHIVAMLVSNHEDAHVLTATENGFGKRTPITAYPCKGRGGQGVIAINTGERNGALVGAVLVQEDNDLMLMTDGGVLIRTRVEEVRETGRAAQGVRLINLNTGEKLVSFQTVSDVKDESTEDHLETAQVNEVS